MTYQHLSMFERKTIYYRYNSGESIRSIGRLLGRCHTTISREIGRNRPDFYMYDDALAHQKALARKKIPRHQKKHANTELRATVIELMKQGWSPEVISGRLKLKNPTEPWLHVSHETIYQWVIKDYKPRFRS